MSVRAAIIDYGLCNLDSVARAVQECGGESFISGAPHDLRKADRLILPGVGAFRDGMQALRDRGLVDAIRDEVSSGAPLLGICLGMQLLATTGDEGGRSEGLGLIEGHVSRLTPAGEDRRIPHVGWNEVHPMSGHRMFTGIPPGADFYFVHSYRFEPASAESVAATTPFAGSFVSAVSQGNVVAVQFHPEKSQRHGLRLLANFLAGF